MLKAILPISTLHESYITSREAFIPLSLESGLVFNRQNAAERRLYEIISFCFFTLEIFTLRVLSLRSQTRIEAYGENLGDLFTITDGSQLTMV